MCFGNVSARPLEEGGGERRGRKKSRRRRRRKRRRRKGTVFLYFKQLLHEGGHMAGKDNCSTFSAVVEELKEKGGHF